MTCSGLARSIEEAVGAKLELRSLTDPQVEHWREQALGKDAPWAPTLFTVKPGSIKAWTGRRMGLILARKLGIVATWRVLQILGEVQDGRVNAGTPQKAVAGAFSRGQFLKGASGTVLTFGLFSGSASPAFADTERKASEAGKQAERAIFSCD